MKEMKDTPKTVQDTTPAVMLTASQLRQLARQISGFIDC